MMGSRSEQLGHCGGSKENSLRFLLSNSSGHVVGNLEVERSRPEMLLGVRNWRSVGPAGKVVVELLRLNLAPATSRLSSAHPRPKLCGAGWT
jgi:hypothetical protein